MRKIFIISLVLLAVVLFFLGIYNFAFKKNGTTTSQQIAQPATSISTQAVNQLKPEKITAISDQAILSAVFDKKNNGITYYSVPDGMAWKSSADGKGRQQIANTKIAGIKDASWSADRSKILTTSDNLGSSVFYEYDASTQKTLTLKNNLDNVVWDNLGSKIFYKYYDPKTKSRTINIANPDGGEWQKLADINIKNISIAQIPLTSLVSFWNFPSASEETQLQTVGVAGGQPQIIFRGKWGADYLWSPNGVQALASSLLEQGSNKITLGTIKMDGTYTNLNIPTLVSKAVWSMDNKTIYYALPGGIPDGAIMPNDYQDNKFTTSDTFWKLDTSTGMRNRIVEPAEATGAYDSSGLFLSSTEDALYFINRVDKKLYKIAL